MKPTNTKNPDYYHQVVNCQWACPTHTDVPEYIRLIAKGRYTEAYLLNRESNVFPGILGRVCDRPCEPACRRGRVEEKPVAICRLKRVAADFKKDISPHLPRPPQKKQNKRVALIGGGPASLTVANDLIPLGYDIVLFEKNPFLGGLMRTNIPLFRLPQSVLDEEIQMIVGQGGIEIKLNCEIKNLNSLFHEFDALFIGSGAPKGLDLVISGRVQAHVHIGMLWLENVAFEHIKKVGQRVVVIGGGNTAMDCARTALRLGAKQVKVVARRPYQYLKASPWELEEAKEEGVQIIVNHAPKSIDQKGVHFSILEWRDEKTSTEVGTTHFECDEVLLAIGQERAFPFIDDSMGIKLDQWGLPQVDPVSLESTRKGVFFGGDAAFGAKNIISAVAHGHQAALSIDLYLRGKSTLDRPQDKMRLVSQKMGFHEWTFDNEYDDDKRFQVPHLEIKERIDDIHNEVELGFDLKTALKEAERCLNCDIQTDFTSQLCIECDACIDICPMDCLIITKNGEEEKLRKSLKIPALNLKESLFVSEELIATKRVMIKDENLCVHCTLCAEKCPTAAWDMKKFFLCNASSLKERMPMR